MITWQSVVSSFKIISAVTSTHHAPKHVKRETQQHIIKPVPPRHHVSGHSCVGPLLIAE